MTNRVFLLKLSQKLRLIQILLIQVLISSAVWKYSMMKTNHDVLSLGGGRVCSFSMKRRRTQLKLGDFLNIFLEI